MTILNDTNKNMKNLIHDKPDKPDDTDPEDCHLVAIEEALHVVSENEMLDCVTSVLDIIDSYIP